MDSHKGLRQGASRRWRWSRRGAEGASSALVVAFLVLVVAGSPVRAVPQQAAAPEAQDVAYQIDPAHDGNQPNETVPSSAVQEWNHYFGAAVSYPLIVGDRVFVTVSNTPGDCPEHCQNYGSQLYALDASNGNILWGPVAIGAVASYYSSLAYDNGQVFVTSSTDIAAFNATTGSEDWSNPGGEPMGPPTASDGVVYVSSGFDSVLAFDESTGKQLWDSDVLGGNVSSPAVSPTGIYVSYSCEQVFDLAPSTGDLVWHYAADNDYCSGGGGSTPVLSDNLLYVRDAPQGFFSPVVLSATTGQVVGTFSSTTTPAFDGPIMFTMNAGTLQAVDWSTGQVLWSSTGDGTLDSAPIVVGGQVFVGGSSGAVDAFDEQTGAVTWSANAGASIPAPNETAASMLSGLGAGDDLLVVPTTDSLVAYGSSNSNEPPTTTSSTTTTVPVATTTSSTTTTVPIATTTSSTTTTVPVATTTSSTTTTTTLPVPPDTPVGVYGHPVHTTVSTQGAVLSDSCGSAHVTVSVPSGAVPAGSVLSIAPATNSASLKAEIPDGQAYVVSFAVAWAAPDGTSPRATIPLNLDITDPAIRPGDVIYVVAPNGLRSAGIANSPGRLVVEFTTDPDFVLALVPRLISVSRSGSLVRNGVHVALSCGAGVSCTGSASLSIEVTSNGVRHGIVVARGEFSIGAGRTKTALLKATAQGARLLSHHEKRTTELTVKLTGGGQSVHGLCLP